MLQVIHFIWWLSVGALVLPFLDLVQRTFGPQHWVERATRARVLLAVLEVGTLVAWLLVRGRWRLVPAEDHTGVALAGAVLALTGALLAAWAKARLGALFSPQLGVQQDHTLLTTGPYAVVRHPIYLGLVDFLLGTALFLNDLALFGVAFLFIVYFSAQLRIEERIFERHFGEQWREYRRRTPALFPKLWRRGGLDR